MLKSLFTLAVAGVLAFAVIPANAGVIYNNGAPDYKEAFVSDSQNLHNNSIILEYDNFSLTSANTIWDMHWWGVYYNNRPPVTDSFNYEIRTNPKGYPSLGAVIASGSLSSVVRTDTGQNLTQASNQDVYMFDAVTPGITLAAGEYYLSIYDTAVNPGNEFGWATINFGTGIGNAWYHYYDSTTGVSGWSQVASQYISDTAFNLTSDLPVTAPEPATMLLLGLGLMGLAGARRKFKK